MENYRGKTRMAKFGDFLRFEASINGGAACTMGTTM
jgi:hypothetical protein